MLLFGHTTGSDAGDTTDTVSNRVYTSEFTVAEDCLVSKLSVAIDGDGPTSDDQTFRAVIYADDGSLLGEGTPVEVENLAPAAWVDFPFATPVAVGAGSVHIGLHSSTASSACRVYRTTTGSNLSTVTDTYLDGAAASGFTPSNSTGELLVFATFAYAWTPPDEDDEYLANLGFHSAQASLGSVGDPRTKRRVYATWHGTYLDPQPQGASLAVVQAGGELDDLVGERVRVVGPARREVSVYIHRAAELDLADDTQISLTRRAWQALARLNEDTLLVSLEVIRGDEV